MVYLRALAGLAFFCTLAWLMSSARSRFPWRVVLYGLALQVALGLAVLKTDAGRALFDAIAEFVKRLIGMAEPGALLVFGPLANGAVMADVFGPEHAFVFAFAGRGLVAIIFISALMSILYHLGIMQAVIYVLARLMSATMGVSGAESMAMAANIFVGQTEAPLVVKPYIAGFTLSELNALMTGGFATIAGSVLAVYLGFLGPEYGAHLLTASVMAAPGAFVMAKILRPETQTSATAGRVEYRVERTASNVIEAAANGTSDGLKLWLNVIAMLIAFMALIQLVDWPLGALGQALGLEGGLSLARVFSWVFAPVSWMMGVQGWGDCQVLGSLLGIKLSANEFVAYSQLQGLLPGSEHGFASPRSATMATYALCGFANFASIGIQLGGITPLAPERKTDLSRLALRAMLGGAMASCMSATIAGMLVA
jgi:CNT family concentrative nucleoside transporter